MQFTHVLALYDPFGVDVPLNFDITHSLAKCYDHVITATTIGNNSRKVMLSAYHPIGHGRANHCFPQNLAQPTLPAASVNRSRF